MPDDLTPKPLNFTIHQIRVVEAWPPVTSFSEESLRETVQNRLTVEGDMVTVHADNGDATYQLDRDATRYAGGIVATLVDGDTPGKLRQAARKFARKEAT